MKKYWKRENDDFESAEKSSRAAQSELRWECMALGTRNRFRRGCVGKLERSMDPVW